jgi:hypothetical protein
VGCKLGRPDDAVRRGEDETPADKRPRAPATVQLSDAHEHAMVNGICRADRLDDPFVDTVRPPDMPEPQRLCRLALLCASLSSVVDELLDVVRAQWEKRKVVTIHGQSPTLLCPFVFHREGRQIKDPRKSWNRAREATGLSTKMLHDFRRTAARDLVRGGVNELVAMKITGHKTESVFDRYNIVTRMTCGMLPVSIRSMSSARTRPAMWQR